VLNDATVDKFAEYGKNVFDIPESGDKYKMARAAIEATRSVFFREFGLPSRLSEVGIKKETLKVMADKLDLQGAYVSLKPADVLKIYEACF
jgi:alcohol dehydrogenase YqhD (iron-dependent ADH family)